MVLMRWPARSEERPRWETCSSALRQRSTSTLEGSTNGSWVSWYAGFATSPLVLGYNPSSKFAAALKSKPWYEVVGQPGFLLGRTDPTTDPKGVLAVEALDKAAKAHHLPGLATLATSSANVFPETSLVGELQAGQLDAGFFYGVEASAAHLKTVPLAGTHLSAQYTITVLNRAPHAAAARAFVAFLLGKSGRSILKRNGLVPSVPPTLSGRHAVPKRPQAHRVGVRRRGSEEPTAVARGRDRRVPRGADHRVRVQVGRRTGSWLSDAGAVPGLRRLHRMRHHLPGSRDAVRGAARVSIGPAARLRSPR